MGTKCELYMPVAGEIIPLEEANSYLKDDLLGGTGVCIIPDGDLLCITLSHILLYDNFLCGFCNRWCGCLTLKRTA